MSFSMPQKEARAKQDSAWMVKKYPEHFDFLDLVDVFKSEKKAHEHLDKVLRAVPDKRQVQEAQTRQKAKMARQHMADARNASN